MRLAAVLLFLSALPVPAVIIDRIAVVVGAHVIKTSDIERDLRLTDFLNQEPLNLSPAARRQAAGRLVDQEIIRADITSGGYARARDSDAEALLRQIQRDRFGDVEARLAAALQRYGLTEDELRRQLLWQLTVLKFIQQRFQPGVYVSDDDVRAYYDQHLAELRGKYPRDSGFQALEPKIRSQLEGEAVNRDFESWLADAHKRTKIEYHQDAFK